MAITRIFSLFWMMAAVSVVPACSRIDVRELPAYALAMQKAGSKRPRLFYDNQVIWESMPAMVPYAILVVQRGGGVPVETVTRQVWWKAQDLKADAVRIIRHGYTFNDPAILEYGASLTDHWQKIVAPEYGMLGICLRVAPTSLDLRLNETGALHRISPELKEHQVEKWDRLIAVNDVPVDVSNRLHSRHLFEVMKAEPGQDLKLTWERPGAGIRETVVRLLPNTGFAANVTDSLEWRDRPVAASAGTRRR